MKTLLADIVRKPVVGSTLTVAAGISFFFTCMLLPLVGKAGSSVPHAAINRLAFLGAVCLTLALSGLATTAKMLRRAEDGSPLPRWSFGLCAICIGLLLLHLAGLLSL